MFCITYHSCTVPQIEHHYSSVTHTDSKIFWRRVLCVLQKKTCWTEVQKTLFTQLKHISLNNYLNWFHILRIWMIFLKLQWATIMFLWLLMMNKRIYVISSARSTANVQKTLSICKGGIPSSSGTIHHILVRIMYYPWEGVLQRFWKLSNSNRWPVRLFFLLIHFSAFSFCRRFCFSL